MATDAQTHANRENAKKSTGPRTPEGKAASSRNSLVHGMTSGKFLPPDADPDEFFQLLDHYRERFQPFDEFEDNLVERLAAAEFKMRSLRYADAGLIQYHLAVHPIPDHLLHIHPNVWAFNFDAAQHNTFTKLARYEGSLQREFSRALRELRQVQQDRRAETQPQPPAPGPQPREQSSPTKRTQFPAQPAAETAKIQPQPPAPGPQPREGSSPAARNGPPNR